MAGYHINNIPKGIYGEIGKIKEEYYEFEDAIYQNNPLMALQELSDLIGAIEGYLNNYHSSINLNDLITMSHATRKAFQEKVRQ